ncbi:MAG: hypothetical protein GVY32_08415 [Gammaproteobacteria bacterium]|nr:hypothetical protein [Gammaproteobacteria bacterium]
MFLNHRSGLSPSVPCRWALAGFLICLASPALSFDSSRYLELERAELRAAERRLSQLVDRETGRVLETPRNAAERYVVERELHWRAELTREPVRRERDDGSVVLDGVPDATATFVTTDENGEPVFVCTDARAQFDPGIRLRQSTGGDRLLRR